MHHFLFKISFACLLFHCSLSVNYHALENALSALKVNRTPPRLGKQIKDRECRAYHELQNSSKWCSFIRATPDCAMDEGFVNYLKFAFCHFQPEYLPAIAVLYAVWLLFLFIGLGTTAEGYFCPSLEFIARNLKLSHNIAGLTIVAFGNGAPDIFSAIAAFTNSNPSTAGVAIGALLGAALMVTTLVAGLVAITCEFDAASRPFLRDMIFFMATVFWLFCMLFNKRITLPNSVGFLALYITYVAVALIGRYINQRQRAQKMLTEAWNEEERRAGSINDPTPEIGSDERSPLLVPSTSQLSQNANNNNLDGEGDWLDSRLRIHPTSRNVVRELPIEERGVEADETITSTEEAQDDDFEGKSSFHILFIGLNPIEKDEWNKANILMKILTIFQIPWNLVCKLTIPLIIADSPRRAWNRPLHCLCLIVAPVFCVFATKGGGVFLGGVFPLWGLLLAVGVVLAAIMWFTSNNLEHPKHQWVLAYFGFVVAIIWTYITANEIVNLIQTFGVILNVNNVIMGLTFLAWGNSIADVVADVTLAKQGFPRMSLSACFGGPLFNVLIGVGLSCTINAIKTGKATVVGYTLLEPVLCGSVLFGLAFNFVVLPFRKFRLTRAYGWCLVAIYFVCLTICILVGLNVIHI